MKPDPEELKRLLASLLDGHIEQASLSRLVQISRVVVQVHLRARNDAIRALCQSHGISEIDLAYDCIGELFVIRGGIYPKLRHFADSLGRPLREVVAAEVFVAWRGLLVKIANAHVAHLYALADPEGGRIYRNIREQIRKSPHLTIRRGPHGLQLHPAGDPLRAGITLIPREQIERDCLGRAGRIGGTGDFLRAIAELLAASGHPSPAVLLQDAVAVMKLINSNGRIALSDSVEPDLSGFSEEDVRRILAEVLYVVKEKIVVTYISRGKLSRAEGEAVYRAMADLVRDWCDGHPDARSLQEYLGEHHPVTESEYFSKYRPKMEYLVKLARTECESWLLGEL